MKEDDDLIKALFNFMFGGVGSNKERKKNIRKFNGYGKGVQLSEKENKLIENKKKWTVALLKQACSVFGLPQSGSREELCTKLAKYLQEPYITKEEDGSSTPKKRKSIGKGKGSATKVYIYIIIIIMIHLLLIFYVCIPTGYQTKTK